MSEAKQNKTDKIDVGYVAHLARLDLDEAEKVVFQGQLEQIVDLVRKIGELDVSGIEPTSHAMDIQNVFKSDEVAEGLGREDVLANAPASAYEQFLVPKIVE